MAAASSWLLKPCASAAVTTSENSDFGTAFRQASCASERLIPVLLFRSPVFMAPATTSSARIRVMSCFALAASPARAAEAESHVRMSSAIFDFMGFLAPCGRSRDAVARAFTVTPVQDAARHEQVHLLATGH